MRFVVVHTTYGRPSLAIAAMMQARSTFSGTHEMDYYLGTQLDDPRLPEYRELIARDKLLDLPWFHYHENPSVGAVDGMNMIAAKATGPWSIMLSGGDDLICPANWDVQIADVVKDRTDTDYVVAASDGYQKYLLTVQILGYDYYTHMGFFNDAYLMMYADTEYTEIAYRLGKVIEARHIVFPHNHPNIPGSSAQMDDTYRRKWALDARDREIFYARRRVNFGLPDTCVPPPGVVWGW